MGYLVEMCAMCINYNSEYYEEKCLSVPFLFSSEKSCESSSGDGHDTLYEGFNDWLQDHGKEGWFADDSLECCGKIKEAVDPVVVTNY